MSINYVSLPVSNQNVYVSWHVRSIRNQIVQNTQGYRCWTYSLSCWEFGSRYTILHSILHWSIIHGCILRTVVKRMKNWILHCVMRWRRWGKVDDDPMERGVAKIVNLMMAQCSFIIGWIIMDNLVGRPGWQNVLFPLKRHHSPLTSLLLHNHHLPF